MTGRPPAPAPLPPLRARPLVVAPQLLDLVAAASRLAVAPRTLREWAAGGRIPYCRLGRALRFTEADLAAFIEATRIDGRP